jgi:hypothetical protein
VTEVTDRAVQIARDNGHDIEDDPPFASSARRWTCARCQRAVIVAGLVIYGTATTQHCDGSSG